MINFFRAIRQNLVNEGKASKYLKYAVGEIVLVVIGILIALQINNWNENRKNNKARIYYTQALLADLQKDSLVLSFGNKLIQEHLEIMDNLSLQLSGPLATIDTLNKVIKNGWDFTPVGIISTVDQNTFARLTSTGNLNFFDRSLARSLQNYYEIANGFTESQNSSLAKIPLVDSEALIQNQIIKPGPLKEALWQETDMKKVRVLFNGLTSSQYTLLKRTEYSNNVLLKMNQQLISKLKSSL